MIAFGATGSTSSVLSQSIVRSPCFSSGATVRSIDGDVGLIELQPTANSDDRTTNMSFFI
jgi:hypothetical protein